MGNARLLIYYIWNKFIDLIFNQFTINSNGVSIGWISVVIVIFGIMISYILSVARSSRSHQIERNND